MDPQTTQNMNIDQPPIISAPPAAKHGSNTLIITLAAAIILILILLLAVILLILNQNNRSLIGDNIDIGKPIPSSTVVVTIPATATPVVTSTPVVSVCGTTLNTLVLNSERAGLTPQQLFQLIGERWLGQFKSTSRCLIERLEDYRVDSIQIISTEMFQMTYAVAPSDINSSNWFAGNGVQEGSYIVHKVAFVNIKSTDTGLGIASIGTGP